MLETYPADRPLVEIVKVTKVYSPDIVALQNISLSVAKGELLFLTGRSGAGKTTLLKLICCVEKPNKGVIEIAGKDLNKLSSPNIQALRRETGVAYQDFKILPRQTVYRNIAIAMEVNYTAAKVIKKRIDELLDVLKLTHKRNIPAGKLSRGEQQRVAIARAAATKPPLILADEPTGNLDPAMSLQVMGLFEKLNEGGSTIIIATHDETLYKNNRYRKVDLHYGQFATQSTLPGFLPPANGNQQKLI
ncbi:MAG: cell division ATP-binding protein FtsE [Proteobacteria bacterium]|nr:cell division ATP-binding protein FtsE [Pseudomonadota bacterium]MBU1714602.1 cell division ATP-binding protein FtsE [Pseudomonadota bacterium]